MSHVSDEEDGEFVDLVLSDVHLGTDSGIEGHHTLFHFHQPHEVRGHHTSFSLLLFPSVHLLFLFLCFFITARHHCSSCPLHILFASIIFIRLCTPNSITHAFLSSLLLSSSLIMFNRASSYVLMRMVISYHQERGSKARRMSQQVAPSRVSSC